MENPDPPVDSRNLESQKLPVDAESPKLTEQERTAPLATGSMTRRRVRVAVQMLGSLLLGGIAILGSILIFRQGLLPLIEAVFHPGPGLLSVFRRTGLLL